MLDQDILRQLSSYMERLQQPIRLLPFFDQSSNAKELEQFIEQISKVSSKITLISEHQYQHLPLAQRQPAFAIASNDQAPRIAFAGLPMGHEFTSLVLALLQTSGYPPKISDEVKNSISKLASYDQPLHFTTYISLSCHNCPDVVQALNIMAVLNPHITHTMVDGGMFKEEIEAKQIMAVPSVYLNGQEFTQGRIDLEEIIAKLAIEPDSKQIEKLNNKEEFDVLIVGGGPAGAAAAIYAARKGIRTGIVTERFGGQVLDTLAIENFISQSATEGSKLVANLEAHVNDYQVDIMRGQQVIKLEKLSNNHLQLSLANSAKLRSKTVILSTGARWRELNVPGEIEYRGKGVAYCPHCDGPLFKGKNVAVVGGGNSGVEAAIDLAGIVSHVTLLEFAEQLRADEVLQAKLRSLKNVHIITNAQTTEVLGANGKVNALVYKIRSSGEEKVINLAGVFVQIGLLPNSEWLKETLELTKFGEISIDQRGQTSLPGVFAAGDCTTTPYKQIIIAMGSGATAALSAFDYLIRNGD